MNVRPRTHRARTDRLRGLFAAGLGTFVIFVAISPSRGAAQVTLLVPAETATTVLEVEAEIAEAIRQALGAVVHRVEPSLEDLALAAGCPGASDSSSCVARIAGASGARLVVVERATEDAAGYRVHIDLRRGSDGRLLRSVQVTCRTSADCGARLVAALEAPSGIEVENAVVAEPPVVHPARTVDAVPPEPPSTQPTPSPPARVEAVHLDLEEHVRSARTRPVPVAPNVLFAVAVASSLGAMIAGGVGVGVQQSLDTFAAIVATQPDGPERLSALTTSRDLALAFGTGLALAGACLAAVGAVMMAESPRGEASDLRLSMAIDPSTAAISLGYRF